ncbi:MAG: AraC family transcriptional regulator [Deltaproteobacteria bacterium]|nr:MAG: AraC family transcriptional regulator [Deltaproteobacteria bacterium]
MAKTRHAPLDGPVWVRTYPVTFLHDVTQPPHDHAWHQLTFATRGHLEVITDQARHIVPADRAVWVPAGTQHAEVMRAPISMRSIYISRLSPAGPGRAASDQVRTIAVTPLLRELILHISRIGALDRREPEQARLVGVLLDQLAAARDVSLALPSPRDPRARRFAELITRDPGNDASIARLARKAGASLRTIERCFLRETGVAVGDWRRRVRLFHALRLLEDGASVTQVALDVGYASTSAFSQAFTRQFGRSPTGRPRAAGTH